MKSMGNMYRTKIAAAIMSVLILGSLLAGCGGAAADKQTDNSSTPSEKATTGTTTAAAILPMRWVLPGTTQPDTDYVAGLVNEKLKADGVNVEYKPIYIGWDVWEQKTNVMFATGEEFEMIHTMDNNIPNTSGLVAKNAIVPLDDLLAEYAPKLKQMIPDWAWSQASISGKIYAIPAMWIEMANVDGWITMRKDLLDKYDLKQPTTIDEVLDVSAQLQKNLGKKWYMVCQVQQLLYSFERTYDTYPFFVKQNEELAVIYNDGKVGSWLESPEFKKDCEYMRKAYTMGLINPDFLSIKPDQASQITNKGEFLFMPSRSFGTKFAMQKYDPDANPVNFLLNPEKPMLRTLAYPNCNTVSATSQYPEAAVMFMDWMYGKQENMDLLMYGEEGKHWKNEGDRKLSVTEYNKDDKSDWTKYSFGWWQAGWAPYQRFNITATDPDQVKYEATFDDKAQNFIGMGFSFDPTPVKTQFANCSSLLATTIYPIKWGYTDYDSSFPQAIKKMKEAGLDSVIAEYQKQFSAWLAAQK